MILLDSSIDKKHIVNPLTNFIIKIHNSLIQDGLNFIDNIRVIIYQLHLLNYTDAKIMLEYIYYIADKNLFDNTELTNISMEAALNEHKSCIGKKPFYNLEKFFIYIKRILIRKYNK